MTLLDVVNLGKVLEFKSNRLKTNVDEPNERYSAYKIENDICIRIANHRTKLRTWLNNFKDKQFPKKCISIVFLHENEINQDADCKLPENVNFTVDEYVYNMDNINLREVFNQLKGDITDAFKTGNYANNTLNTNNKSIKALKYKLQKENNMENNMKNSDRKILESLITKYGKSDVNSAINKLNENEFTSHGILCSDWFGSCNNCKLVDNKSTMDRWMSKKINDILKTGKVIDDGFSKTAVGPRPDRYEVYEVPKDGQYIKYDSNIIKYSKGNDIGNYYYIPNYVYNILEREFNRTSKTNIVNEMVYEYDYNRLSDCPLTYNAQLDFKKYFIKRSTQEGYKFNKNIFYFDDIDCVDIKTSRDIPDVKANKTLNFDEAYNRLLKYFLNNLQEQVNESDDSSMYDAFGEVIYPGDFVIVVAHNDKYPEGKLLKGTFVKLAANSRLVGVVEIEEYDQKMYKFPKYIKEPQICIAKI